MIVFCHRERLSNFAVDILATSASEPCRKSDVFLQHEHCP
jgi:hypothetical protein